ncbi:hypothetical protein HELRODRAFT_188730 [Helobdella robusta]|uniref:Uncharacterized protein n=1 Tax=Helobdella robusta TaxID=6412 RepID=T1FQB1_HELRO|nr:hypothetical protein HELRODRAFT_188730 [Helobdella robusta]ESO02515.1 hypothetical protein HELRODRAFT_188730 [Helobdella robusta]
MSTKADSSRNDASMGSIGFMISTPEPTVPTGKPSYMKNKFSVLNIISFILFILVLIFVLVSLVSPYWMVMREPWIERLLVPKQFQIDPEKHSAWIGLYSACNTENNCNSGTPYETKGWFRAAQITYAMGFVIMLLAFVVQCMYLCCLVYIKLPNYKIIFIVAIILLIGAIFCSVGLGLFGSMTLTDGLLTPMSLNGPGGVLTWAFFLGIVGTSLAGITSLIFLIDGMVQAKKAEDNEPVSMYMSKTSNA